jgi:hypothetical protein
MESLAAIQASDVSLAGFRNGFIKRCHGPCNPAMAAAKQQVHYCTYHLGSTSRRDHLHRRRTHVSLIVPMLPSRFHSAEQFPAIKRLRQHVPSAQIQSFTPKVSVGLLAIPGCFLIKRPTHCECTGINSSLTLIGHNPLTISDT